MNSISYGDLASSLKNMRLTSQVKQNLERYNYEVASGQKSDLREAVSGDFTPLASLERSIRSLGAYSSAVTEAELFTSSLQSVLGAVSDQISDASANLLAVSDMDQPMTIGVMARDARGKLDSVVSVLNTRVGGRALMGGAATGSAPLASSNEMMAEIEALVLGEVDAAGVITVVDDWFNAVGGGFETNGYLGSQNDLTPFALNENQRAAIDIKADDQSIRDTLKGLVLASLVNEGILEGDLSEQRLMLRSASETLMSSEVAITTARAHVGTIENTISEVKMANSAEGYVLEMAKSEIVSADVYDSAAFLAQTQAQLEMIYTITARLSRMKLSDYL
ncbi:flagellin [Pacificibacter marinus]|uniref:Flagellar hook-associated protein FlgL n=1 Tax=Pacificibacter marinus TaxID=658057 RepID=A0A1Y5SYN1_9RHOB|nr:flagellin [Pacificibacter marinus]SEL04695.1 flagellar hook-associated protein 3 FlgL [Pacificibacter marinus]SLN51732.1 flagellar hook-associated protein FlgL [Pacificibacter marinus]